MPIIKETLVHELSVHYYYTKNKGNYQDNMSRKTSNNAPKQNNGYCKLDIKVIEKTYDTNKEYYYISTTYFASEDHTFLWLACCSSFHSCSVPSPINTTNTSQPSGYS